jgi:antitoxin VapB
MSQTAKIFRNGRNQAVRIPVEMSFDSDTVTIERQGDAIILKPHRERTWPAFLDDPETTLPDDFDTGPDPPPDDAPRFADDPPLDPED